MHIDRQAGWRLARLLMEEFARVTGLEGEGPPRRYLWTDAFAVCNFLGLYRQGGETGEVNDLDRALRLVDQVHHLLGQHRADDLRQGWISGLPAAEGERHPTRGGLRIGKELPELRPGEAFDPRLEWDRDGQYFHYLTQWMHALARVGEETGQPVFRRWAIELAKIAHARFTVAASPSGPRRLVWKMSIDLGRPLVPSMGQHDPLDAWLAYLELEGCEESPGTGEPPVLAAEIAEAEALCAGGQWATDDALGIGALLVAIYRLARRRTHAGPVAVGAAEVRMLEHLVAAARISLEAYPYGDPLGQPAESRLAFRELGLAIGLHALERIETSRSVDAAVRGAIAPIAHHLGLAGRIDVFWSAPAHRQSGSWRSHREINSVMLATSLAPEGYLGSI